MYAKDGQVKFLNENFTKLQRTLYEERNASLSSFEEQRTKFDKERATLKSEISSLKAQKEFKQHDMNKSNFTQSNPRLPTNQFSGRTKSFGELAPPVTPKRNPETNGFHDRSAFAGMGRVAVKEESCQTGSQDDGLQVKSWKLRGKGL